MVTSANGNPSTTTSATQGDSTDARALLKERNDQIQALQQQVTALTQQLQALQTAGKRQQHQQRRHHPLTPHATTVHEKISSKTKKFQLTQERSRMGRSASLATRNVLNALPDDNDHVLHPLAQRIVEMFKDPASHMDYLNSQQFSRDLLKLNHKVRQLLEKEPRVVFLQSPAYVFGDIHGNLEDLHFFSDNVWRLGMSLTAGNFVFLGDYVDRGMSCLECIAYLLAMKLQFPHKVFLLRGNHETRDVNGWEEHYGERSFMYQCRARFGDDLGYRIWEQTNQVFDRMPLAAVIDQDIFCVHGGIPRPVSNSTSIQDILNVPRVAGINPPYGHEEEAYQQVASDCIWSDPASEEQEMTSVDRNSGFGESLRGGGAICFGHKAVTNFLKQQGMSYIMRAHEAHAEGVAVSKGARVFTVFSTSKDHNQGSHAMAGCILVDFDKLQVINRSPAYRNQYVHRRDSVSLAALSETEIQDRMRLGLVTNSPRSEDEQWDDMDENNSEDDEEDSEDEENFAFDLSRKSSVDASHTCPSPLGSAHHHNEQFLSCSDDEDPRTVAKPRFSSINEELDEDEVETVDGEDEAMEN